MREVRRRGSILNALALLLTGFASTAYADPIPPGFEALNMALEKYKGTLIFVSHDRQFVSSLATHILELDGKGGFDCSCLHSSRAFDQECRSAKPSSRLLHSEPVQLCGYHSSLCHAYHRYRGESSCNGRSKGLFGSLGILGGALAWCSEMQGAAGGFDRDGQRGYQGCCEWTNPSEYIQFIYRSNIAHGFDYHCRSTHVRSSTRTGAHGETSSEA